MPQNRFERIAFAFLTVIVTVHAYVFYSLYVVNGKTLMAVNGTDSVLSAINTQGGVYTFGRFFPIWAVVLVEFLFAFLLEIFMGSPASFKLACRAFDIRETNPVLFETAVICATAGIMCPAMSFIAAWLYYPYYAGFNMLTLLADWLKLVCFNFPFAVLSQLFFIQPLIRTVFKLLFRRGKAVKAVGASNEEKNNAQERDLLCVVYYLGTLYLCLSSMGMGITLAAKPVLGTLLITFRKRS